MFEVCATAYCVSCGFTSRCLQYVSGASRQHSQIRSQVVGGSMPSALGGGSVPLAIGAGSMPPAPGGGSSPTAKDGAEAVMRVNSILEQISKVHIKLT